MVLNNREVAVNLSVYPYRRKNRKNDRITCCAHLTTKQRIVSVSMREKEGHWGRQIWEKSGDIIPIF